MESPPKVADEKFLAYDGNGNSRTDTVCANRDNCKVGRKVAIAADG